MRRIIPLFLVSLLAFSLAVPVLAEEYDDGDDGGSVSDRPSVEVSPSPSDSSVDTDIPDVTVSADSTKSEDGGVTVNVSIQQGETPSDASAAESPEIPVEDLPVSILEAPEDDSAYRTFTVVSPDDDEVVSSPDGSAVMADVVVSVLGEYRRKTQTVTEMDSDGNILATSTEIVPGLAGLDYEWIAGAAFFGLVLYSLLRLIGGVLKL